MLTASLHQLPISEHTVTDNAGCKTVVALVSPQSTTVDWQKPLHIYCMVATELQLALLHTLMFIDYTEKLWSEACQQPTHQLPVHAGEQF